MLLGTTARVPSQGEKSNHVTAPRYRKLQGVGVIGS
jgi:hypothetical protein